MTVWCPYDGSERAVTYTPGPWTVQRRSGLAGREVCAGELVVATVNTTSNTERNREANARLIAAAPELLALIERVVDNDAIAMDSRALHTDARALLARITTP